jgi:hypothetical protein
MKTAELTIVATKKFKLRPFGKFHVSMRAKPNSIYPNSLDFHTLSVFNEGRMTLSDEDYQNVLKLMRKNKTSILIDGTEFYTTMGNDIVRIEHTKINAFVNLNYKRDYFLGTFIPKEDELANPKDY